MTNAMELGTAEAKGNDASEKYMRMHHFCNVAVAGTSNSARTCLKTARDALIPSLVSSRP
jgi:hypothetical protein